MIQIDLRSPQPIYEQIVGQVKEQVLRGLLRPGDAMPSIRKLSQSTRTNPNTVARAYQELERMGILETLKGRGTFIRADFIHAPDEQALKSVRAKLHPLVTEMRFMGMDEEQIVSEIRGVIAALEVESI